nr:unnamed protein product [Spirometra erinaceieuropaei]
MKAAPKWAAYGHASVLSRAPTPKILSKQRKTQDVTDVTSKAINTIGYPVSILVNFGQPSCTGFSCNPSAYCDLISGVPTCICRSPLFQEVANDANGPLCGFSPGGLALIICIPVIALMLLIAAGICCSFCERRRTAKFRLLENVAEEDKEQGRLSAEVQSTHF